MADLVTAVVVTPATDLVIAFVATLCEVFLGTRIALRIAKDLVANSGLSSDSPQGQLVDTWIVI